MTAKNKILAAGLELIDERGLEAASVASICKRASVSNGSFFHAFSTKEELGAELFMEALISYHDAMIACVCDNPDAAKGVSNLITGHLGWVQTQRTQALLLFEHVRAEWRAVLGNRQAEENERFGLALRDWREPQLRGKKLYEQSDMAFMATLIGPAQIICRAWLGGRSEILPLHYQDELVTGGVRSLVREKS